MRLLPLSLFAIATLGPLAVLVLAIIHGGWWSGAALLVIGPGAIALDLAVPHIAKPRQDAEFPAETGLLIGLGLASLALLPALTWAIAGPGPPGWLARLALFVAGGLWFGQVSHPAAHELIHRPRPLFWLGGAIYTALLFGHHTSSHRLVHHQFVASPEDPNSARSGESYYRFAARAWPGSFRKGWQAETRLRHRSAAPGLHPYALYVGGAVACLALALLIAGPLGIVVWAGLGFHAAAQILLSDYVQHYGLSRAVLANGKLAPVAAGQSWNTPHWFSSAMMLNAPRHSDHHSRPNRAFPALELPGGAPCLPWPLPLACLIALQPRRWRARMLPLLARLPAPLSKD